MASGQLLLLAVIALCTLDLLWPRGVSCQGDDTLRVLLVPGGSPYELEGLVRYLRRELSLGSGFDLEIAVLHEGVPGGSPDGLEYDRNDRDGRDGEYLGVTRLLTRRGLLVERLSGEPSLVFHV